MIKSKDIEKLYWEDGCDVAEVARKTGTSFWSVYCLMKRAGIPRRNRSLAAFAENKKKPQFLPKSTLSASDELLKTAGIMLYWAEGTLNHNTVDFANSNPGMIKIFLKFLREICGIKEERLRIYLYAYAHHDIETLKTFWQETTSVPLSQFTKPYVRSNNANSSKRKLPYGLIHIRYNDKRLLALIKTWIDEYIFWAGTQVAKGDRLSKAASC